jgi:hypothetical protein
VCVDLRASRILAGVFRGKVWLDSAPLQHCVVIITRIVQMQTLRSPLRKHWELIDDDDEDEKGAIEEKAAALRDAFEVVDGMRIGRAIDIRRVDGNVRGPVANEDDTEPLDNDIDTGFRFKDFQKGQFALRVCLRSLSVSKGIEC